MSDLPQLIIENPEYIKELFINKEFFIFLLPSFYIFIMSLIRIYQLKQLSQDIPIKNVENFGYITQSNENMRTSLLPTDQVLMSYNLKKISTIVICIHYLITFGLSYIQMLVDIEYDKNYSFWYLFMAVAQIVSLCLLKFENEKNEPQSVATHRVFWPFQTSFFFLRLIQQSYVSIQLFAIVFVQLLCSAILTMYGLYKPSDNLLDLEEIPTFAKEFFQTIEQNKMIMSYFQQSIQKDQKIKVEMGEMRSSQFKLDNEAAVEFSNYLGNKNDRTSIHEQENFLENQLPKRAITVSKRIIRRFLNDKDNEIYFFYQVITQIDQKQYLAEKRYPDFLDLERCQVYNYNELNKDEFPLIEKIELKVSEEETQFIKRRSEVLEKWLKIQMANAIFISRELLTFLNVDEESQQPFLLYVKMKRKIKEQLLGSQIKSLDKQIRKSSFRHSSWLGNEQVGNNPVENYISEHLTELTFSAWCSGYEQGQFGSNSLLFVINILYHDVLKGIDIPFRILKTLSQLKSFTKKLEIQLGRNLPLTMNQPSSGFKTTQEKIKFVDSYFKNLFRNESYYCALLFQFIEFDVLTRQEIRAQNDDVDESF